MSAVLEAAGATPPPLSFIELPVNNSTEAILDNIRRNLDRGLPGIKQRDWTDTPLAIVGGGPSLHDYLPHLRAIRGECHILAVNGAYKFLRGEGMESEHFMLMDSRRDNIVHVESPAYQTMHYLASQVHPDVFDALRDYEVTMFHLATETGIEATKHLPDPKSYLAAPIGMASIHAIYLAASLGYRNLLLFGYDMSYRAGEHYAFNQTIGGEVKPFTVTLGGKTYETTLPMARTAEQFQRALTPLIENCKLNIRLMCTGLLPEIIKAGDLCTEDSERQKYEDIWRVDLYRKVSPGLEDIENAITELRIPAGSSIADFGCGTGRCVAKFNEYGFKATGVDIASNCLEEDVLFVRAALWDAASLPLVDYGFSCDVLEHIPAVRVRDTLKAIHDACRIGCYLNIDTIPDSFGVWIGKTLHETVLPAEQWEALLKEFWPDVRHINDDERQAIFVCFN